ncbi:PREDICTED: uncharacterized protein LOC107068878 [Polistes dominula]|uniref:Uncharacterized protein LOC107068878 n=1 Tax=Polistes dominula TaxID=743375 RepID=A0ABM1ILU8_POLDO|nr:PREDICTED: uncharacterized protein LOC107068878 [Polistes dominula]
MGSSQSTEHNIPKSAYEKAQKTSTKSNLNHTEHKIYPDLHKPTTTSNIVEPIKTNVYYSKNASNVTHYPEELANHMQNKEFHNNFVHYHGNSSEFVSPPKEKLIKQLNLNQEKVNNDLYKNSKEMPSAPPRSEIFSQSIHKPKPPAEIKNLQEFINSWNMWKEDMRLYLMRQDYNKKDYDKWGLYVLNFMGSISLEIFENFIFNKDEDKNNFTVLIDKFDAYHKFITTVKFENESVINYIKRLKDNYTKNIKDIDNMVKNKIQEEIEKFYKERFIAIASSKIPDFNFKKTLKSLTITEIAFLWDLCNNSIWEENKICKYCGRLHPKDKCFAFGKECNKCKRRNHFSKYCPGVMYINNCSFCGGDHGAKRCLAYDETCSKCNKLHHFSWMCSKIRMLRNCKFCGLAHVMDRSKCPALISLCSICKQTGHYDIKCPKSNV